ncbi:MAG: hypothetical protein ACLFWF_01100 [Alphaproteobacteria bacterium]
MKVQFNGRVTSFGELALGSIFLVDMSQTSQYCLKVAPPPGNNRKDAGLVTLLPGIRDYDGLPGFVDGAWFRGAPVLDLSDHLYVEPVINPASTRFSREEPTEGVGNLLIAGHVLYLKARVGRRGPVMAVNMRTGETAPLEDDSFHSAVEVSEWDIVEISGG